MAPLVEVEVSGNIGIVTLNRPERHNSLVPELLGDFLKGLAFLRTQAHLRVLLLEARGRSFSTGGDVRAFYDQGAEISPYAANLVQLLNDAIAALLNFPVPVVAVVHGMVTGGSLGFVLASDIVLMAPEATITPYYAVVGFSPDGGWTALLPQVIGLRRTAEVLMRNLTITADQAVQWGLASRVVPLAQIHNEARSVAAEIAAQKPSSIRSTRRLLWSTCGDVLARLAAEHREFCANVGSAEAKNGMAAFLGRT